MKGPPAAAFGLAHWVLLALVQAENIGARHLAWLPLMQWQNLIAAALMTGLAWIAARAVWSRWLFFAGFAVVSAYVALDPSYFHLFADHLRFSAGEGVRTMDPATAMSSLSVMIAATKAAIAVNAVLLLIMLVWLGRRWLLLKGRPSPHDLPASPTGPSARGLSFSLAGILLLAAVSWVSIPSSLTNAARHPLYPLIQEAAMPRVTAGLSAGRGGDDAPVDAQPSTSPALAVAAVKMRAASPRPNMVLVVLESVGVRQLLTTSGLPDPQNTPNLAALARSAIVFDSVYAPYPATVRTHLAINTGGHSLTWSNVSDMAHLDFTGPLLGRDFARAGYATALFSSERLDVEAMDQMEQRAGWGTLYDFARDVKNHVAANVLNSWSAKEEFTLGKIEPWMDEHRAGPFLLVYMNGATHHPYSVPRDTSKPAGIMTPQARFAQSLRYTDGAIGKLIEMLKIRGIYENTIIAVTGDHGEAFGEHPGNFAHKNAIYEENVRCFLLLAHPALGTTGHSDRVGMSGDIFPTLAALAGLTVKTPGVDLLARDHPARAIGFTKGAFPEQWGRRDGRWKFIQTIREKQAELYDLSTDPAEKQNVASAHPDLVTRFSAQCERWYLKTDAACAAQFSGYTPPPAPDLHNAVPKASP